MIHPQDQQSFSRILGIDDISSVLEDEYEARLHMFHSDGNSGPLGTIGIIDLLRSKGYGPGKVEPQAVPVNWLDYQQEGSVRVEALVTGNWEPGVFLGFVESGTLAVRLDADPIVREFRPAVVRLSEKPESDAPVVPVEPRNEPVDEPIVFDGDSLAVEPLAHVDFAPGDPVWVEYEDDIVDGTFVSVHAPGIVRVNIAGIGECDVASGAVHAADRAKEG